MNTPFQQTTQATQATASPSGTATGQGAKASPPLMHEADIGSGEKSPGQEETEEMIRQIPPLPEQRDRADPNQPQQQQPQQQQQQQPPAQA